MVRSGAGMVILVMLFAATAKAQDRQIEAHPELTTTVNSHQDSWGGGAQYQLTWGAKSAPVRPAASLGADWVKPSSGPSTTSVSLDGTVNLGGGGSVTPFLGASASENWSSGSSALGLFAIAGLQHTIGKGPWSVNAQGRWGFVKDQEHQWTIRAGLGYSH